MPAASLSPAARTNPACRNPRSAAPPDVGDPPMAAQRRSFPAPEAIVPGGPRASADPRAKASPSVPTVIRSQSSAATRNLRPLATETVAATRNLRPLAPETVTATRTFRSLATESGAAPRSLRTISHELIADSLNCGRKNRVFRCQMARLRLDFAAGANGAVSFS